MNFHEDNAKYDATRNVLIGTFKMPLHWYITGEGAELDWGGKGEDGMEVRFVYRPEQHPCEVSHFVVNYYAHATHHTHAHTRIHSLCTSSRTTASAMAW